MFPYPFAGWFILTHCQIITQGTVVGLCRTPLRSSSFNTWKTISDYLITSSNLLSESAVEFTRCGFLEMFICTSLWNWVWFLGPSDKNGINRASRLQTNGDSIWYNMQISRWLGASYNIKISCLRCIMLSHGVSNSSTDSNSWWRGAIYYPVGDFFRLSIYRVLFTITIHALVFETTGFHPKNPLPRAGNWNTSPGTLSHILHTNIHP